MRDSPMFSVIVPVYNLEKYVEECVLSLLRSAEGFDVEVICVEDGSTDGSAQILDEMADRESRLKVIHQANAGVAEARNRGVSAARGEWLMFVDGDDFVRESYFSTIARGIENNPDVDLVGFCMAVLHPGGFAWRNESDEWEDTCIEDRIGEAFVGRSVYLYSYKRSKHGGIRFPPYFLGEDLIYVARAVAQSRKCVVTQRQEYCYRYRADSATHAGQTPERMREAIAFAEAMFTVLSESGKKIAPGFQLARGCEWLESIPRMLAPRRHNPEWRDVWKYWLSSMSVAADQPSLSQSQRRRARRVARHGGILSVWLNCHFPSWLRRKGLMRRI